MQARTPDHTGYAVPSRIWKLQVFGCPIEAFEGTGRGLPVRHSVRFNVILREFVDSVAEVAR